MITNDLIRDLKPCADRWKNYLEHYIGKAHSKKQFMGLKNITHEDKLWVAFRLMSKDNVRLAALDIASLVLHLYEDRYPGDLRPRQVIEAARIRVGSHAAYTYDAYIAARTATYAADANTAYAADAAYAAANAAYAYAYDPAYDAACTAARNAVYAAAADTVYEAAYDAADAAAADAASTAAYAVASAAYVAHATYTAGLALKTQPGIEKQIRTILLRYWK